MTVWSCGKRVILLNNREAVGRRQLLIRLVYQDAVVVNPTDGVPLGTLTQAKLDYGFEAVESEVAHSSFSLTANDARISSVLRILREVLGPHLSENSLVQEVKAYTAVPGDDDTVAGLKPPSCLVVAHGHYRGKPGALGVLLRVVKTKLSPGDWVLVDRELREFVQYDYDSIAVRGEDDVFDSALARLFDDIFK
ncbi:MAG: hypothetical protein MZV70_54255 [Desulfobacterales bacterium]|nr:hypothetical protein [Desulfobacterales bacterium]